LFYSIIRKNTENIVR